MAFVQRLLSAYIQLASGSFGSSGGNGLTLSGLRMTAHIEQHGLGQSNMELAIYGMKLSEMNQLSLVGIQYNTQYRNSIALTAIDENGTNLVFGGIIQHAWVDAQAMPEVCFRIEASPGAFAQNQPIPPTTIKGPGNTHTILSQLAKLGGFIAEPNGKPVILFNPYLPGTVFSQIKKLCEHAGFDWIIERGVLAWWPVGTPRAGGPVLIAAPKMVGYPMFRQVSVIVTARYDPAVKFNGQIQVKSTITPACGVWNISKLTYDLDAMLPRGKWFMTIEGQPAGQIGKP